MCSPLLLSVVVSALVIATLLPPRLLQSALWQHFFYTATSGWTLWGILPAQISASLPLIYPTSGVQSPKKLCTIAICYCNKWLLNSKYPSLLIEMHLCRQIDIFFMCCQIISEFIDFSFCLFKCYFLICCAMSSQNHDTKPTFTNL